MFSELRVFHVGKFFSLVSKIDLKSSKLFTKFSVKDGEFFFNLSFSENIINNGFQDFFIDLSILKFMSFFIIINLFICTLISHFKTWEKISSELTEFLSVVIWSNNIKVQSNLLIIIFVFLSVLVILNSNLFKFVLVFNIFIFPKTALLKGSSTSSSSSMFWSILIYFSFCSINSTVILVVVSLSWSRFLRFKKVFDFSSHNNCIYTFVKILMLVSNFKFLNLLEDSHRNWLRILFISKLLNDIFEIIRLSFRMIPTFKFISDHVPWRWSWLSWLNNLHRSFICSWSKWLSIWCKRARHSVHLWWDNHCSCWCSWSKRLNWCVLDLLSLILITRFHLCTCWSLPGIELVVSWLVLRLSLVEVAVVGFLWLVNTVVGVVVLLLVVSLILILRIVLIVLVLVHSSSVLVITLIVVLWFEILLLIVVVVESLCWWSLVVVTHLWSLIHVSIRSIVLWLPLLISSLILVLLVIIIWIILVLWNLWNIRVVWHLTSIILLRWSSLSWLEPIVICGSGCCWFEYTS